MTEAKLTSSLTGLTAKSGKVRDVYDLGNTLLLVSTDRISAFDWVFPSGIPDKGKVLTQLSRFWFEKFDLPHHMLGTDIAQIPLPADADLDSLTGRSMHCKKAIVFPVECVVRNYLVGSGWKEYQQHQSVCGIPLPAGLQLCSKLEEPIFTPATKAEEGHDENISFEVMCDIVGTEVAEELRRRSLELFAKGAAYAETKGIIIADTKFEFGLHEDEIILIDEVLTPDSSRFWPVDQYQVGRNQFSFDKQFVRDWLETTSWDKNSEPPILPAEIIRKTREKYIEVYERLTETPFNF